MLFSIFINDLDNELEGIQWKFAGDTKLGGALDSLKDRASLQRDIDEIEGQAITNHMGFNKDKGQILHLA